MGSKPEHTYGAIDPQDLSPIDIFGEDSLFLNYRVDELMYWVKGESLMGKVVVGGETLELRADARYRVLRFEQMDGQMNEPTGQYLFLLVTDPRIYSIFFTSSAPIEEVYPDWPDGVEFPKDSFVERITNPKAKTLFVDMEALWEERGGDRNFRGSKDGGWGSKHERDRKKEKEQ